MSPTLASPYSPFVIGLFVDVLLKGSIVLGLAGVAAWFLRRTAASVRHLVWSLALGTLLVLPFLEAALPAWRFEPFYVSLQASAAGMDQSAIADCDCGCLCDERGEVTASSRAGGSSGAVPGQPIAASAGGSTGSTGAKASLAGIAQLLWSLVAVALLGRLGLNIGRVRELTQAAPAWGSAEDRALGRLLAANLRIRRRVRFLESDSVSVPVTWGVRVPAVIFPIGATDWTRERKSLVLLHELAHVRRWDYAVHLMVELVCAVYWFNPLVWLAARLNNLEQERACDDQALNIGVRSDVYAEHLIDIARAQIAGLTPRGAFAMARSRGLAGRVRSILARGLDRGPITPRRLWSTSVAAIIIAFPLASIDIWGTAGVDVLTAFQHRDAERRVPRTIGRLRLLHRRGDTAVLQPPDWAV